MGDSVGTIVNVARKLRLILLVIFVLGYLMGCARNIKPDIAQLQARMALINDDKTQTVYYFTKPNKEKFPIVILCDGSTSNDAIESVWRLHQFEQFAALKALGVAIITIEKDGVDVDSIDKPRFFANYTRSRRFKDHVTVIDHVLKNPPQGFDGRLIFIGASEGGPLVNQLSIHYPQTIATINWSGAGDWSWHDELWAWIEDMRQKSGFLARLYGWWYHVPKNREQFDSIMAEALKNPSTQHWFLGMTYRYHADAIETRPYEYKKFHAPMLVVCGTKDSLIDSCDAFVEKAKSALVPITYWRIEGMEHRISHNKENIIPKSFAWLKQWL